jgi:hypothetical protein
MGDRVVKCPRVSRRRPRSTKLRDGALLDQIRAHFALLRARVYAAMSGKEMEGFTEPEESVIADGSARLCTFFCFARRAAIRYCMCIQN